MGQRTKKELLCALQDNNVARVSYAGLLERHPEAISMLKGAYLMLEAYEILPVLDNMEQKINETYFMFVNASNLYVIFEIKEYYPERQYLKLLERCGAQASN